MICCDLKNELDVKEIDENKEDIFKGNNLKLYTENYAKQILSDLEKKYPNSRSVNSTPPVVMKNGPANIASLIKKPLFSNCFDSFMEKDQYHSPLNKCNYSKILSDISNEIPINIYDTIDYEPEVLKEETYYDELHEYDGNEVIPTRPYPVLIETDVLSITENSNNENISNKDNIDIKSNHSSKHKSNHKSKSKKIDDEIILNTLEKSRNVAVKSTNSMEIECKNIPSDKLINKSLSDTNIENKLKRSGFVIPKKSSVTTPTKHSPKIQSLSNQSTKSITRSQSNNSARKYSQPQTETSSFLGYYIHIIY